jgi:uncharacterized protein YdeI (YjbR/CyaY-like superfamily)
MGTPNPKVDAYIAKAQPFAQPILEHLRELMHKGCPDVEESIKWNMPFFEYKSAILGCVAGFKEHCSFGFWDKGMGAEMRVGGHGPLRHIRSLDSLPPDSQMLKWIRQTVKRVDSGEYQNPMAARSRKAKPEAEVPAELTAALKRNKKAAAAFAAFSPSCRREYAEWIVEAKREETRAKRVATAVSWIAEGKQRNWKYQ